MALSDYTPIHVINSDTIIIIVSLLARCIYVLAIYTDVTLKKFVYIYLYCSKKKKLEAKAKKLNLIEDPSLLHDTYKVNEWKL